MAKKKIHPQLLESAKRFLESMTVKKPWLPKSKY